MSMVGRPDVCGACVSVDATVDGLQLPVWSELHVSVQTRVMTRLHEIELQQLCTFHRYAGQVCVRKQHVASLLDPADCQCLALPFHGSNALPSGCALKLWKKRQVVLRLAYRL